MREDLHKDKSKDESYLINDDAHKMQYTCKSSPLNKGRTTHVTWADMVRTAPSSQETLYEQ